MVALDIGSHAIKLADFSTKKKGAPILERFATLPVPDNCIEQGDLINAGPLKDILPDFISQHTEQPAPNLYVTMSGRSLIVKKIEVLQSEKELIDDLVQEEVKQNLPFDLDEMNYDYMPMDTPRSSMGNKTNILLVAVKGKSANEINQMIEDIGYKCQTIDMCAFALSDCMKFIEPDIKKKDENILILDIGKSGTMFTALNHGNLIFSRYMMVGSDFYTVNLMKEMGIKYQEAESLKISWCSKEETPPEVNRVMEESDRYFCDEIFVGCEYFKNQFPEEERFSKVYITGGGGKITTLKKALSEKFNLPAHLLDPFRVLPISDLLESSVSVDDIKPFAPVTIGSCLRGIG